jgi:predicted  nucleic acid-binding Zn-ribbon protein
MPTQKSDRRRRVPPVVAAVVQPVAKRLARMEALLKEMRHEQDVKLKRITAVQRQLEILTEHVRVNSANIRRISQRGKRPVRPISN